MLYARVFTPHPGPAPCSHTAQLRGSIPLLWTQIPNIKYKPPTKLLAGEQSSAAFDAHFDGLTAKYKVRVLYMAVWLHPPACRPQVQGGCA